MSSIDYSFYYQVSVEKSKAWFFVAILRSFENVAFDRTLDKEASLFEVFVAPDFQAEFLDVMQLLESRQVISNLRQLPNRLQSSVIPG
jgi:hypothetical protein